MSVELLQTFNDTTETLWTCAWSSNGKLLGASGADMSIRLYSLSRDGASFGLTNELKGAHTKSIRSISFCPRRARLSAASFDGTVSIWTGVGSTNDVTGLKWSCTATLEGHENEVKSSGWGVFLNDQAEEEQVFLATCGRDKTVWIWAMEEAVDGQEDDFECLAVIQEHEQDIKCLAWHPNRPLFLTGSYDESVMAWSPLNSSLDDWIAVGKVEKDLNATVWTVSYSPDGKKVAVGLSNGKIILYDLPEGWKSFDEWIRSDVEIFAAIPIEQAVANGCDDGEGCCSSNSGSCKDSGSSNNSGSCNDSGASNNSGCCSNDQSSAKSGCCNESSESESEEEESGCCGGGGKSKKMQVDSCCSSKKPRTSPSVCIPPAEVYSLSWNSASNLVALACSDHSLRIVDCETKRIVAVVGDAHDGEVNCVAWSPVDSQIFASTGDDGRIKIWKIQ